MRRHLANVHTVTGPAGILYRMTFCRLAGLVAPTGKAIVHWIGCINAIKLSFLIGTSLNWKITHK